MCATLPDILACLAQTSAPAEPTMRDLPRPIVALLAVGVLVLLGWASVRLRNARKLSLRDAPGRQNCLHPLHVLPAFLILFLAQDLLAQGLAALGIAGEPLNILTTVLAQIVALGLCLTLAGLTFNLGLLRGLGLSARHWRFDLIRGLVGYLAVFPVCVGLVWLMQAVLNESLQKPHALLVMLQNVGPLWQGLIAFSAIVLAPLLEEVLFRGLLQSMLRRYMPPWPAVLVASGLFALTHSEPQNLPALFILSVVLGYNYERTGRLTPPIIIHGVFNGVFILWTLLG